MGQWNKIGGRRSAPYRGGVAQGYHREFRRGSRTKKGTEEVADAIGTEGYTGSS